MAVLKRIALAIFVAFLVAVPATANAAPAAVGNPTFQEHVDECISTTDESRLAEEGSPARALQDWSEENIQVPDWVDSFGDRVTKNNCRVGTAVSHPVAAAGALASEFWGDPVGEFTQAVLEGNAQAMQTVMTFWTDFQINSSAVDASVHGVKNIVLSLAGLALIASLIAGGYKVSNDRRRGLVDSLEETGGVIAKYLIFSVLVPPLVIGAVVASDKLADWIMTSFGASSAESVLGAAELNETMAGPIMMLAFAGVAFAGSIMQIVALAIRTLLLPIAAGMTPLFAALSFSQTGKTGLAHLISLMIASIIFKPVSALLYCVVFWLSGQGGDDFVSLIISVVMIGAAGFTGPALVRAIVPAVAQAGGGGAAPVLAGGAAATGAALGVGGAAMGALGGAGSKSQAGSSGTAAGGGGGAGGQGPGALGGAGANPTGGPGGGGSGGSGGTGGGTGGGGGQSSPQGASANSGGRGTAAAGAGAGGAAASAASGQSTPQGASPNGGGRSTATGAGTAASAAGAQGANPNGGGGVSSAGHSTSSQPHGANPAQTGARVRMGAAGKTALRQARTVARGASKVAVGGARASQSMGNAAGRIQGILDEGIGQQGSYHGNVRR
ncbi:hypothetical protein ACTXJY_10490 [Corynebacterium casei]|uniref:hypothetical protein n=1 Tax=Corynebacterium TaxID=1716 RepID=UPI00264737BC|nr:hypothetical protein [Corynebacterium sp.]MDN6130460.1 hypothetical protein [Corynebacterium casei]MDN6154700.1 hypothetical protein [Corynebacterium casei]MDN6737491.1 hypothetical protein [Corynebacterium sp.]